MLTLGCCRLTAVLMVIEPPGSPSSASRAKSPAVVGLLNIGNEWSPTPTAGKLAPQKAASEVANSWEM